MATPLRRVALRRPGSSLLKADAKAWNYGASYDPAQIESEHSAFTEIIAAAGIEILWMDDDDRGIADAIFTYDASLMTATGAILMNPGKALRSGEQELHRAFYESQDIAIIGEISGAATAEAGDTLWLEDSTLAVGRGLRTNQGGIEQLGDILKFSGVTVKAFDLPLYGGEAACLHLMSLISMVDTRTAVICSRLLPVSLWKLLRDLDYTLIDADYDEFEKSATLSANILALGPGRCIMIDGFPRTRNALEAVGVDVQVFDGNALCIGCEGGPTCLSRPILRNGQQLGQS